ncbi:MULTISPECIES: polysaccharide deacetylase family protein [unclassified Rhizobium]|uniref:polysaccharide deacetylase family protein n=1 Tax=unclassified Rhizobium TaxID=2613769 RepID=UPI000DDF9140|nr:MULTISPECIES: polysaccharide deacetylase family protein [unclassified Rhizobium]MBB3288286.1 peptidoglycan/xylan/chitin deacetylase (PgdA/CDA1 family) [Rhizobium sp. BK252]MBB3402851.1 peptidoglycan/xylan/chitin deacetylase (PgdA/CDA1 family) [Rhizobium sp. BK289]MBB3415428.1 peptidoglycan/xylan/chitin deacetylase (PgdA/CDA1 family) [Rhizobium sp. BK284]MBB3483492.1 peptidoglycan/xylan/chitin deacetylase (PgdA/CDA1 family) [Rhizobium sp. BK347]MDK4723514.1 polysaccharide deacetylase family 
MNYRVLLAGLAMSLALGGCATKPANEASLKSSYAAEEPHHKPLKANDPIEMEPKKWLVADLETRAAVDAGAPHDLAGRTLEVSSLKDIRLADKEVILTFDDGPAPGKTDRILATLDRFGVKAAFMMVGEMAQAHPATAREVLAHGDAIGSHTFRHPDLDKMTFDAAMTEIARGKDAVTKAIGTDVPFFRFPYLADSKRLRTAIAARDMIVMDVDIDSKDYFTSTPLSVVDRTMKQLYQRGRGIVLMHDIHQRTVRMLPVLLSRLEKEGFKVVTLKYKHAPAPATNLVAQAGTKMVR